MPYKIYFTGVMSDQEEDESVFDKYLDCQEYGDELADDFFEDTVEEYLVECLKDFERIRYKNETSKEFIDRMKFEYRVECSQCISIIDFPDCELCDDRGCNFCLMLE